jgi:CRP-like cAMP-binding protein
VAGIWLTEEPVRTPIEPLLLEMLTPNIPNPVLRKAELEELARGAKLAGVAIEYLGLRTLGVDAKGETLLQVVTANAPRDTWREALVPPEGNQPVGLVIDSADAGTLVLVHEVFASFGEPEKDLVRRYATLAVRGDRHEDIVSALRGASAEQRSRFAQALSAARRCVLSLDSTVLFSPDGRTSVRLGSLSRTTKDIIRDGLGGEEVVILPASLFEGRTNYADIEFLVYLNFFLRQRHRTRIAGTARQQQVLHRLLTLSLFGLFDPAAPAPPSFEHLRQAYGVESRETYDLLRLTYETYGIRRDPRPDSPLLGIDDYVDFAVLGDGDTVMTLSSAEVRVAPRGRSFDVLIAQADGRQSAKRLEVSPPPRLVRTMPADLCAAIRFASDRPRFGVTPLGTSHGFDADGDFTSFVIWINGKGILVDCSPEALAYLEDAGVAPMDVPYVLLTHVHADHDGGLIEKLLSGSQTTVIASDPVFRAFVEKARLVTGHDFQQEGLVKHVPANPENRVRVAMAGEFAQIESRWNFHPIPTNGFKVTFAGRSFGYSGDTQYDPAMLAELRQTGKLAQQQFDDLMYFLWAPDGTPTIDLVYHEAGIAPIHTNKEELRALPDAVTSRMALVHIADRDVPEGFRPAKAPLLATQVLLPATAQSRERALLETMRLAAYLYDMPPETLTALLRGAEVVSYAPDEMIVRQGAVTRGEPLHFQIVTDGRVSVRDGRRVVATLGKADTFGEWGISHQRGFRVADVVAERPTQAIRLSEEQYHWLVGKHPVVQERIGKIRSLLPRLQVAQQRARQQPALAPHTWSVIEDMTTTQLSSLAIFGKVETFRQGHLITVQGDEADGFYILLSGHLAVGLDGRSVGELSEGEVFGELGLLGGGTREANVTVVSTDADVLFMSTRSFQHLLRTVPAFAWGIREAAAGRRELIRAR